MATTKAPLFGLDASGSLGNAIVFSKWKGRTYVRRHSVPSNPKSDLQVSVRAAFKFLSQYWGTLDDAVKEPFNLLAGENQTTGLNEFVRFNQRRHRFNQPLSDDLAAPATGTTPSAPATFTASNGRLSSVLAWTAGANAPDFYWQISQSLDTILGVSVDNTIAFVPAATLTYRVAPLVAGVEYNFMIRGVLLTGKAGTSSPNVTATPIT